VAAADRPDLRPARAALRLRPGHLVAQAHRSGAVTATPARHGPPLSRALVGDVVGFAVARPGRVEHELWISGDTVLCAGVREGARRFTVDTAVLHLGGVRFPATGPLPRPDGTARRVRWLERGVPTEIDPQTGG
jgi:hypothetical protein